MIKTPSNARSRLDAALAALILATALTCPTAAIGKSEAVQLSGFLSGEYRYFTQASRGAASYRSNLALVFEPEFYYPIEDSGSSLRFTAFYRHDDHDAKRTHADIRELKWHKVEEAWELTLGIDRVFWGVTETVHLVNIINQQDLVENPDGEDLLGQPMIRLDLVRDFGTFGIFVLPYFRERTFAGRNGRPGAGVAVDTDNPLYESGDDEWHTDFALRWSHYVGNWDLGASYFNGTSRDPRFVLAPGAALRPFYETIDQIGVDVQGTFDAWLWKLEAIHRRGQGGDFFASVAGLEYTFFDLGESGTDIGVVVEYLHDERDELVATDNDLSLGLRVTLNDINSTDFLAAVVQDMDNESRYFFVEASRRVGDAFKLSLNARGVHNVAERDPLQNYERENFLQVELAYYF